MREAAKTIAYSRRASGVYVSTEMFAKSAFRRNEADKQKDSGATPVGENSWRTATPELGFQADQRVEAGEGHRHHRPAAGRG